MPQIYDNIENHLIEALKSTLEISYRSDFCVGYFNLRGWKPLADYIENYAGEPGKCCRLLVGMQKSPKDMIREYFSAADQTMIDNQAALALKKQLAQEFKTQLTVSIPTNADEKGLQQLARQIKAKKVIVKLFLRPLHAKLYLLFRTDRISPLVAYIGSSNLTFAGLSSQGELNVDVLEQDAAQKLAKWFDDRWNDRWCLDISDSLAEIIAQGWASEIPVPPYYIYLKMVYHLSREARAGLTEFNMPRVFHKELLEFQEKAVLLAARYLNKRDGVIIGDVVGLGKTMIAAALAKIFEEDFFLETLIICPKNITEMWEDYIHRYQLRAKVLSQSMVQNQLHKLRRYRMVIIDESHNLRNREGKRYKAIEEYIKLNDSKVILLSATPYNKNYSDLSNQLRLFISEDKDLGISPESYIQSLGGKTQFMDKHNVSLRSLAAFEQSDFSNDWRELMRLYLVRRTRSFIKENYALTDADTGRKYLLFSDGRRSYFPDRIAKKAEYPFDPEDKQDPYSRLYSEKVVSIINSLNLPRYGMGNYLNEKPLVKASNSEETVKKNLSRAGRRLMGFARTNLFKRLESSGYSFLLSLSRHILRNFIFIYAAENRQSLPIGTQEAHLLDEFPDSADTDESDHIEEEKTWLVPDEQYYYDKAKTVYQSLSTVYESRFDWIRSEFFVKELKSDLLKDARNLLEIMNIAPDPNPDKDRKLNALHDLCTKIHSKEKILIFTQFADTAYYLEEQLKKRNLEQSACVTGSNENPTGYAYRFSPVSNNKAVEPEDELRILITTDVLSEGQNLQDAHIIVNYDLPWAIIRLIQRAGRVDRIGQKAERILCYSFLPEDGVEQIINLRERLKHRIRQNAEVVGTDETFFDGDPVNIRDLYNEKSGILDDDEDSEVDLASYSFQIWKNATDANPKLKNIIPELADVIYSAKENKGEREKQGVIVYARTVDDNDVLIWVNTKGELITQSQFAILKAARCSADTLPETRSEHHHELVGKSIEFIRDIEKTIGGQLGKKSSVRYRAYMSLTRYYESNKNSLFVNESLKHAIEDIYRFPLKEFARETIGRQLKAGISDMGLAELATSLREEYRLCIVHEDETVNKEPQILCSLGLI
jgi:superfamily II DNA or RNA helicase